MLDTGAPATPLIVPSALLEQVARYLSPSDLEAIRRAFEFARDAHDGQSRESGDPYITHPLAVAETLAELQLDTATISAALLHDVAEDTAVSIEDLEARFGSEVARLVDGVTKLSKVPWFNEHGEEVERPMDRQTMWAESMRKMFLAMADDIRVVLIKLADRLHNMRTLDARPPEKRRRVSQETMDIYAPLAARLGIGQIKWQLEDLSFRHLEPSIYKDIARQLSSRRVSRERYIAQVIETLDGELRKLGITAEITGRPKHIFSIYRKMRARQAEISQIYDLLAVRVLVDTLPECYSVLGQIHAIWRPIPGQFDDYISNRKESGYQSLHTTVVAMEGHPLEIQIRTHEMHQVAEYGVAAHWRYKEGRRGDVQFDAKVAWLRQLMDWQRDVSAGAQEFVDSLKTDVFQDQVYVFTPRGEIKEMAQGATPLDFAYRVHTEVGHKCVGAKVNGRMVPLDHKLQNGDIVEIITARGSKGPSRDWLNPNLGYVGTANAREKIRQWFKRQQRDENVLRGRELVDKELKRLSIDGVKLDDIAATFKYERVDDFLAAVGYGDIHPHQIVVRIEKEMGPPADPDEQPSLRPASTPSLSSVKVLGVGDLLTRLARCCNPVPGDDIIGYITRGKGVTVHRRSCSSVEHEEDQERLVQVDWGRTGQSMFPVTVRIEAWDRVGLARDIAALLADEGLSITDLTTKVHKDQTAAVWVTVEVSGLDKLSRVLHRLEGVKDVFSVVREVGKGPTNGRA
ncbi:MAG TPA: bifunctional (p)ppGpp synthetase/guanosine-3',5'-bis(diphosphate) 3'-pyrophosphohydrolase [Chloroflexota bacterium]|nr:bifunctional (p)ppGpp synthetase/guanosine-3',5'-bis(diphosphate) 3'-pyrophosphohydrolase [Chloroflexota bacterium]